MITHHPMQIQPNPEDNFSFDASDTMYPSRLRVLRDPCGRIENKSGTIYGVVLQGVRHVRSGSFSVELPHGGFFSCRSEVELRGNGTVVTFERFGFLGIP